MRSKQRQLAAATLAMFFFGSTLLHAEPPEHSSAQNPSGKEGQLNPLPAPKNMHLVVKLLTQDNLPDAGVLCRLQNRKNGVITEGRTNQNGIFRKEMPRGTTYRTSCMKNGKEIFFKKPLVLREGKAPYTILYTLKILFHRSKRPVDSSRKTSAASAGKRPTGAAKELSRQADHRAEEGAENTESRGKNNIYEKTITLKNVLFASGSSYLNASARKSIDQLIRLMRQKPKMRVEIAGHTDSAGSASANKSLSQKRADSVRSYILRQGIAPVRVTAKGYGESEPIASNRTKAGRKMNRRTEARILRDN